MSGIYIPGMEMPESCFECPFMFARRYCCANLTLDLFQGDYDELKGRVDGCPLVPAPEHGDLIDKGTICNECRRTAEEYDGIYPDCTYCPVYPSPTIIPADHIGDVNEMVTDKEGE